MPTPRVRVVREMHELDVTASLYRPDVPRHSAVLAVNLYRDSAFILHDNHAGGPDGGGNFFFHHAPKLSSPASLKYATPATVVIATTAHWIRRRDQSILTLS